MLDNQAFPPQPSIPACNAMGAASQLDHPYKTLYINRLPFLCTALALLCLLLVSPRQAAGQSSGALPAPALEQAVSALPDAPEPQSAIPPGNPMIPFLPHARYVPGHPLTLDRKFELYEHQTFGPPAFFAPAFDAGVRMADPTAGYPPDWKDGPAAFGRLYGNTLATQTSKHTAEFLADAAFHYDPRYAPSHSTRFVPRVAHAVAYVFVQKTDSGATAFALPHFAGAAAGGFVGMAYLPPGYNDLTHAGDRAASELGSTAIRNLAEEFSPELTPIFLKFHLPRIIPTWWTQNHSDHQ